MKGWKCYGKIQRDSNSLLFKYILAKEQASIKENKKERNSSEVAMSKLSSYAR